MNLFGVGVFLLAFFSYLKNFYLLRYTWHFKNVYLLGCKIGEYNLLILNSSYLAHQSFKHAKNECSLDTNELVIFCSLAKYADILKLAMSLLLDFSSSFLFLHQIPLQIVVLVKRAFHTCLCIENNLGNSF